MMHDFLMKLLPQQTEVIMDEQKINFFGNEFIST